MFTIKVTVQGVVDLFHCCGLDVAPYFTSVICLIDAVLDIKLCGNLFCHKEAHYMHSKDYLGRHKVIKAVKNEAKP